MKRILNNFNKVIVYKTRCKSTKMSQSINISEDVKSLVADISKKYYYPQADVMYRAASKVGDNYASKTVTADIITAKETINLFVKYALDPNLSPRLLKLYTNETLFYDVIYPAYLKFEMDKKVKDPFTNVPKCIATSPKHVIALENLRYKNYELFDRRQMMNEGHIAAVLKTFAKYHAVSFAFKDQEKEKHKDMAGGISSLFDSDERTGTLEKMIRTVIGTYQHQLHPVEEAATIARCSHLSDSVANYFNNLKSYQNDNSIITKGDCWSNNIMFRYDGSNKDTPTDVMLIDWQLINVGSPVLDLSYFLYSVSSQDELAKIDHYKQLYHEDLSKQIKLLGSNPESLYPYSLFETEWKENSIFGYGMSLVIFNVMLMPESDDPNVNKEGDQLTKLFTNMQFGTEYYKRMKNLTEHFIRYAM